MAFLCISLDNSSVNAVHILDGDLTSIDKYTIRHNNSKSILKEYPEKIAELRDRYNIEGEDINIKVRIFLPNDKEQFILYHKHLIAFKHIIKDRKFLSYAVSYDNGLFNKNISDMIEDESIPSNLVYSEVYNYLKGIDEERYYKTIRDICSQYINYKEDNEDDESILSIDAIYKNYIENKQESMANTSTTEFNPFAVFEHPNFFKIYGNSIDLNKPIFILGENKTEEAKKEYEEIYENTKKCFHNKIYYPLNADVFAPINEEFKSVYSNSLVVIVCANGYSEELLKKIYYASKKDITVLALTNDNELKDKYQNIFEGIDTIIVKDYEYGNFKSMKEFADIMVGLYINEYKKSKAG